MNAVNRLHLFQAFGVELEYMVVDAETLSVRPIVDELFHDATGEYTSDVELPDISWCNELASHVVELKTSGPASSLGPLVEQFNQHVGRINSLLTPRSARLMPTAMHPWMDPEREMRLWPHENSEVYEAFHRIFNCRGHGWANLQSVHLNLPFADDAEFGRLHAAIRLLLPLLPALAASSPLVEGLATGLLDSRLDHYRTNCARVPSVAGEVIPEAVYSQPAYQREILQTMYEAVAPLDPGGVLRHEWLNARGAIARFSRRTIEIRVLDVQECPAADLAICAAAVGVLRAMCQERWTSSAEQQAVASDPLIRLLHATTRDAGRAMIDDPHYLAQFGCREAALNVNELWHRLIESLGPWDADIEPVRSILEHGTLAERILQAVGSQPADDCLRDVYRKLCDCLAGGRMFLP